ncbi:hypothetical protein GE09DRAFT_88575 [Coniochaeta sp. 2T2.1]|nr:hypothetical protein GE09DRAFT_88575 [Coniochaeta sp. 2T2.1]
MGNTRRLINRLPARKWPRHPRQYVSIAASTSLRRHQLTCPLLRPLRRPACKQLSMGRGGLPSTTTVQQPTTLPETTIIVQHVTTDSAGRTSSQSVTSIVRETTSTMASAVVLHPGQSWVTTTGPVTTSTISSKTALQTTIIAGGNGETVTSVYWTTLAPTTVVVTATYGTVIGAGSRPAAPTGTAASSSDTAANSMVGVVGISRSQYLSGSFLPTLIAVLVAMPLKTIGINARLFQPFITLKASPAGATAEASVFLRLHGWRNAILSFPRAVILRQPVVLVGQLLVVGSALLAPLAAEAVRVYVPDGCTGKCPGSLGVDITAGRILQVLMALLISLLVGMAALLAWLKTGVKQHPWSIAGMAALCVNREMKGLLKKIGRGLGGEIDDSEFSHVLGKHGFTLGCDGDDSPYGIRVTTFPVLSGGDLLRRKTSDGKEQAWKSEVGRTAPAVPLYLLTLQGRIFLLLCFTAVLVLLLGYENSWGTSNFERFMNDQGFGVRFLFTALGVALGFSMSAFFRSVAVLSPYLMMSQRALPAQTCILVSPASNTFSGVYSAFRQRHLYLGVVAATSLLADFLPVTLSHVPFSVLETHEAQYTCAYLSIAILVMMILVVAGSLAVRWPHMPADPRTIAGALYYLCDSGILDSFSGLAAAEPRDRNWMVKSMCVQYRFGNMIGLSGKERICIDAVDPGVTEEGGRS